MKKIFICGDSFAVPDNEYGPCWVDLLPQDKIENLAKVAASNLLISQQVDQAIESSANFILCFFTSSTRQLIKYENKIVPISWPTLSTIPADDYKKNILKNYFINFFDLETAIYENKCIIENILNRLDNSQIPYLFDQGGFEHRVQKIYFENYAKNKSKLNLWDYASVRNYRPYYHIMDKNIHKMIADYYINELKYYF